MLGKLGEFVFGQKDEERRNLTHYTEEQCINLFKKCWDNCDFSPCKDAFAKDIEYIYAEKGALMAQGREYTAKALKDMIIGMTKDGRQLYSRLGKVESYQGDGVDKYNLAGRHVVVVATSKMMSFDEMFIVEMNQGNRINRIFLKNIDEYIVTLEEKKHYGPDEYIYLNLIKAAIESRDSSRLINYLDYNVEIVNLKGEYGAGCYPIAYYILRNLLTAENIVSITGIDAGSKKSIQPHAFLVKIRGTKKIEDAKDKGRSALALSLAGFDECMAVMFIEITDNKISLIRIVENNYVLEKLEPMAEIFN